MEIELHRRIATPVGELLLRANEWGICALELTPGKRLPQPCQAGSMVEAERARALLSQAEAELAEYFAGRRRCFSVPLCIQGTVFQALVWRALADIPYGHVETYASIARRIGRDRACRAVGMACNQNKLPILLPCHRVLGAGNRLTGYAGGLEMKKFLLELEREHMGAHVKEHV